MKRTRPSLRVLYAAVLILALVGVLRFGHAVHAQSAQPILLQVGFQVLYRSKHIPGSIYAGPASKPEGLQTLREAVHGLSKNTEIYLYCGCCPIDRCPNIRPAFRTLKAMGYTHLHVLMLETSFGQDWVAHGYPIAGESAARQ